MIPYVTAGDPDLEMTKRLVREMVRRGGDIIEIGVPFSDPLADGPIIQRASQRALQGGTTLRKILQTVSELRPDVDVPLVLMTYYNPVFRYGEEAFVADALDAGVDGIIVPDLPPEEAQTLMDLTADTPLDMIFLAAPTSTSARLALISEASRGFIYYVSRLGTTGVRDQLADDLRHDAGAAPGQLPPSQLPSVSASPRRSMCGLVAELADGVVVASAILKLMEDLGDRADRLEQVGDFVAALKAATRIPPAELRLPAS